MTCLLPTGHGNHEHIILADNICGKANGIGAKITDHCGHNVRITYGQRPNYNAARASLQQRFNILSRTNAATCLHLQA